MAKKQKIEKVEVPVVETPVVETPKPKKVEPKKPTWEIKDRVYYLKSNKKPISKLIKGSGIYWFDEEKGYERELKYTSNQKTCFVDEMVGDQRLEHIIFSSKKQNCFAKTFIFISPFKRYYFRGTQATNYSRRTS